MRNLSPWTALAAVWFAAAATTAGAAYEPAQPQTSQGQDTPKMQGGDNGTASDSATLTAPANPGNAMQPDPSTPDEHQDDADLNAKPDNPASPFSPVNPAAPALQDPKGGDPTNPVTPASMRYLIIA